MRREREKRERECVCVCVCVCVSARRLPTHFASSARAMTPAAMGAEALVPVNELMQ